GLAVDKKIGAIVTVRAEAGRVIAAPRAATEERVPVVIGAVEKRGIDLDVDIGRNQTRRGVRADGRRGEVAHDEHAVFDTHFARVVFAKPPAATFVTKVIFKRPAGVRRRNGRGFV